MATSACPSASPRHWPDTCAWCMTGSPSSAFSVRSSRRAFWKQPPDSATAWARPSSTSRLACRANASGESGVEAVRHHLGRSAVAQGRAPLLPERRVVHRAAPGRIAEAVGRAALSPRRPGRQRLQPHRRLALEALRPVEAQKAAKASNSRPAEEESGAFIPSAMAWRRVASGRPGKSRSASAALAPRRRAAPTRCATAPGSPHPRRAAGRGAATRCARTPRNRQAAPHRPRSCRPSRGRARRG
jgi:hypothetical protein